MIIASFPCKQSLISNTDSMKPIIQITPFYHLSTVFHLIIIKVRAFYLTYDLKNCVMSHTFNIVLDRGLLSLT